LRDKGKDVSPGGGGKKKKKGKGKINEILKE